MEIDSLDLKLIRAIEWGGVPACNSALARLNLPAEELRRRLQRLRSEGLIQAYRASVFVPPFLGGEWFWACTLIQTRKTESVVKTIRSRIPFVTEMFFNRSIPPGVGPNLSILFYTKDLKAIQQFLSQVREIDYVEVYRIAQYDYPLVQAFSSDELACLKAIVAHPDADLVQLSNIIGAQTSWVQSKLQRLVWDPENPQGVLLVIPEISWGKCSNYRHIHFVLEVALSPETALAELSSSGLVPVLDGRLFRNKYMQLEADVWGFDALRRYQEAIENCRGVQLVAILSAEENLVVNDWVSRLLSENG